MGRKTNVGFLPSLWKILLLGDFSFGLHSLRSILEDQSTLSPAVLFHANNIYRGTIPLHRKDLEIEN